MAFITFLAVEDTLLGDFACDKVVRWVKKHRPVRKILIEE